MHEASDVHTLPKPANEPPAPFDGEAADDDALEYPPPSPASDGSDAFADFEDEMEGENTRIDDSQLLAEQSTAIIQDLPVQPFLLVEKGNDLGREFVLQDGENGIGRGIDNDVILADVAVSRRHLKIMRSGETLTLKDLGSGNGTQVNGQKVSQVVLAEGDRIEAGETTMVVRLPGALTARDPYPLEGLTDESHIGGSLPPANYAAVASDPFVVPQGPGYQPELTPSGTSTEQARSKPGVVVSKPVLIAILAGGSLLLAMFGAAIALVVIKAGSDEEPVPSVTLADDSGPFDRGVRAFEAHRWVEAEAAFNEALQQSSDNSSAHDYLQRTRAAREHEGALEAAETALRENNGNQALQHATGVPQDSPLAGEAQELARQARAQLLATHIAAGRAALGRGEHEEARRQVATARNYDAASAAVAQLSSEIEAAAPAAQVEEAEEAEEVEEVEEVEAREEDEAEEGSGRARAPGRAGRRMPTRVSSAGGVQASVISSYLAGRFDQAVSAARAGASRARGSERTTLEQLATRIDRFKGLWTRIQAARFAPNVRREMEQAIGLDRQIARSAQYRNRLTGPVVAAHLADARRLRSNPTSSCQSVRSALGVDSSNGQARQMGRDCEVQAGAMLREAQNAPPARATAICRQVMLMVPASSSVYREARTRFQSLRRRTSVDEDE